METVKITRDETRLINVYGGSKVQCAYTMTHLKNGQTNSYKVICTILGLDNCDIRLYVESAEYLGNMEIESNDETLTNMGAVDLFESYIGL